MRRLRWTVLAALALAWVQLPVAASSDGTAARGWVKRLTVAGRGEVSFVRSNVDPLSGREMSERGRLVLEPPGRAEVFFPRTGERLTVRPDGGEWLQPALGQMIRFGPGDAEVARAWWKLLIDAAEAPAAKSGSDRLVVGPGAGATPDSAWVRLDRSGLPVRLTLVDAGVRVTYRLGHWTFSRARGPEAFEQQAPDSVQVVDLR